MGTMGRLRGVKVAFARARPSTPAIAMVSGELWFQDGTPLRRVSSTAKSGSEAEAVAVARVEGEVLAPGRAVWFPHAARTTAPKAIAKTRAFMSL
jgi:hypothetical protein